jgi:hypothetical protein
VKGPLSSVADISHDRALEPLLVETVGTENWRTNWVEKNTRKRRMKNRSVFAGA